VPRFEWGAVLIDTGKVDRVFGENREKAEKWHGREENWKTHRLVIRRKGTGADGWRVVTPI